jgi:hypothetical protein
LKNVAWMICTTLLLSSVALADKGRALYKWVDADGVTHYGDRIPPEYAGQEQHIINSQGVEISRMEAQKSPEQQAADDLKKQELTDRQNRDRNLVTTYASVAEIERLRDQRLTLVSDQIKVTTAFLDTLNGRMKKLRAQSMQFKPYNTDANARPMPDQTVDDLVRLGNDIHTQEQNLRQKRGEEVAMSKQFASDIERFKELRGIH